MKYILCEYDNVLEKLTHAKQRFNKRTNETTFCEFGVTCRYDISESFPLLLGREINYKAVFAELCWFLKGQTNVKQLENLGAKIWSPWQSKEFEDKHGFAVGSLGPVYGFQLRHFGGDYNKGYDKTDHYCSYLGEDFEVIYGEGGVDQLTNVLKAIEKDPSSRSILWSLWNPAQASQMRLQPCHILFQLDIEDDTLSGCLYQRSADWPIGVAFNVPFYSALIYIIAAHFGLRPNKFVHMVGNAHIYANQMDAVAKYFEQLSAMKNVAIPTLELKKRGHPQEYFPEDFVVHDYNPAKAIKIPVAVGA